MSLASDVVVAIDQGTTNTKVVLVRADGSLVGTGSAPVGVVSPRPGWVEQDAERIWASVEQALAAAVAAAPDVTVTGVALSTQRESVVGWHAGTGRPLAPVIGWQDSRTADWCDRLGADLHAAVVARTGLRVDAMFSAPKLRWLLDHLPSGVALSDVRVGTVDSWLV
jgi:glycerol kinase